MKRDGGGKECKGREGMFARITRYVRMALGGEYGLIVT